jgi:pimeloyl-ACP methyl ester carboxylesterase
MIYRSERGASLVRERYLKTLDHWPVTAERLTVPTRHGDTFVLASGPEAAPPVVLLHGTGTNLAAWQPQIATLSSRARVYAVDLIGEPGLSAGSRPPLDSEAHTLWLDDVLKTLELDHAALVGESLGGWMALDFAARRPERVSRLAVLNPSGIGSQKMGILLKSVLLKPAGDWGRRRTLQLAAGPSAPALTGERADFTVLVVKHFKPRMQRIPRFTDETLRRLTMPLLAVAGAEDVMLDAHETAARLETTVPHAEVRLLPDAGHILPDQSELIVRFLRD